MHIDDTTSQKLAAAAAQTLTPLLGQLRALNELLNRSMQEFWASPNGRALRVWIQDHANHPDQLNTMRAHEAAPVSCDCLCRRWSHLGSCTGWATAQRNAGPPHHVVLQVCGPCAAEIDAYRANGCGPVAQDAPVGVASHHFLGTTEEVVANGSP